MNRIMGIFHIRSLFKREVSFSKSYTGNRKFSSSESRLQGGLPYAKSVSRHLHGVA
jgi:hypothetical protein